MQLLNRTALRSTGIGIIDCQILELPTKLLRDHHRGAIRVKQSTIGAIREGFIHNIDEVGIAKSYTTLMRSGVPS